MKRRELIAGLGALGIVGAGAAYQTGALDSVLRDEEEDRIEPIEVTRFEAPGSTAGTETVPEEGRVTYLALFATWCGTCASKMEPLGEAAAQVGDDVQFVSMTSEALGQSTTEADVIEWWEEHDGNWPVTHDEDLDMSMQVDARGVPYSAVIDAENRLVWSDSGYKTTDEILSAIDEAR